MAESVINGNNQFSFSESNRSGSFQMPNGMLIQWGQKSVSSLSASGTTNFTITFPIAYSSVPYVILNHYKSTLANAKRYAVLTRSVTTAQINGGFYNSGAAVTSASTVGWIAIGEVE